MQGLTRLSALDQLLVPIPPPPPLSTSTIKPPHLLIPNHHHYYFHFLLFGDRDTYMMEMILRFTFTFSAHIKIIRATVGVSRFQILKHVETENAGNDFPDITSLSLSHPRLLSPTGRE